VDETSNSPPTDPSEGRAFSQVINGLQKSYPRDKMEEISTSFCFICLLHLANEQGLKLESSSGSGEINKDTDIGRRVGDIWGLKVYHISYNSSHDRQIHGFHTGISRSNSYSCCIICEGDSITIFMIREPTLFHLICERIVLVMHGFISVSYSIFIILL
jgi:hypothetical protein